MTLEKAIEILDNTAAEMGRPKDPDFWDAQCLGIEALKCIQRMRQDNAFLSPRPLPGETKQANEVKLSE